MAQIICLGASTLYGVGGTQGGWPDYLKRALHTEQYGQDGVGERNDIFNLGKSGVTIEFIRDRLGQVVEMYGRPEMPLVLAFMAGTNNARAWKTPDGYISTPEEFRASIRELLSTAKQFTDKVLITEVTPVNEALLNPKKNPWDGTISYFYNERIAEFSSIISEVAIAENVISVPLFEVAQEADWASRYLYTDGLHPNDAGHEFIYKQVRPKLEALL
jgi:lysophospholipase L1-like esterase